MGSLFLLKRIVAKVSKELNSKLLFLIVFSIFVSFIELIGVSLIMPLIELSTDSSVIQENQYYNIIFNYFNFKSQSDFVIYFGIFLLAFYFFRGVLVLLHSYYVSKFSQDIYKNIVNQLFKRYLHMPYEFFIQKNRSVFSKSIITEASLVSNSVSSLLTIISEIFVVLMIYFLLMYVNYKITILVTIVVIFKVLFLIKTVSKRIKLKGVERDNSQQEFYKILNVFFNDYKNIKLQGNLAQKSLSNRFLFYADKYAHINTIFGILSSIPRVFIETVGYGMVVLFIILLLLSGDGSIQSFLPTISLYVVALYRILPSVNRIMNGYNTISFNRKASDIVFDNLNIDIEKESGQVIFFREEIELQNVSFSYQDSKNVITNCNLSIKKNEKIAIVGKSGSGKSTLIDLISGLLTLSSGRILIDGVELSSDNLKSWRKKIGYIPQNIFLFDGTIAQNVCFGREYNKDKLIKSLKLASIYDFLLNRGGVEARVGDGGVNFSGGQMQRIAIARSLYGDPEILIFDEATSALDSDTEESIMNDIYSLTKNMTFILITHKLSIASGCDRVFKMNNKTLINEKKD